jgi:HlyD family secretion protein
MITVPPAGSTAAPPVFPVRPLPAPPGNGAAPPPAPGDISPDQPSRLAAHRIRRLLPYVVGALACALAVRSGVRWYQLKQSALPAGIVSGNGRLEADEIDIDTKFPERVAELFVNEGDLVHAGQPLARMDTRDLEAARRGAQASLLQADSLIDEMRADMRQQQSQADLAKAELERYRALVQKDYDTREDLDQRQQTYDGAVAALGAMNAKIHESQHARDAARHVVELANVNIRDNVLVAPRDGRILYRIANLGEVLPAGGKVFTMLDATSVYMDIYLPTADAGRVRLGGDGRIVLDAYPQRPIPASVSYLASEAQFTPKAVETKDDRDKLMFRVKVRIDSTLLHGHEGAVRIGLPGVAYVRVDSTVVWPSQLRGRVVAKSPS